MFSLFLLLNFNSTVFARDYIAYKAGTAPTIDGNGKDACWTQGSWYAIDQVWLGAPVDATDFSGRFKLAWDGTKFYILGEITDNVLNDAHPDPLVNYYDDDTFEIFVDEDHSGGPHETSYNAFAYHVSTLLDVVDTDVDGKPKLFNNHIQAKWTKNGNVYTWECAVSIYTDKFVYGSNAAPISLTAGKQMGFALAYCDNDGASTRDNFFGSEVVAGTDKNVGYKDASIFGTATLVDAATGLFEPLTNQNETEEDDASITLISSTGTIVAEMQLTAFHLQQPTWLPSGIYYYIINRKQSVEKGKLFKN